MNKIITRLGTSIEQSIRPCSFSKLLNFKRHSSDTSKEEAKPEEMDQMKSNPYFSKYEAKLKAVYK